MNGFFSLAVTRPFQLFSPSHWVVLLLVGAANLFIYFFRSKLRQCRFLKAINLSMALLLLLLALAGQIWDLANGIWSVQGSLPLHLCGLSLYLCPLLLITKNYRIYEIVYFWGVAGATQALLTPAMNYAFPHFVFMQFFLVHGLIVTSCLWMTFVGGFQPLIRSLGKAFLVTNGYALLIALFNHFTGSNYLFISQKPATPSLLDFLAPWPWYIVSLEFICLLFFFLCYLPFKLAEVKSNAHSYRGSPDN